MTVPTAQIAKLLPRLASTHDGEVVATARAIERVLKSSGSDWHDLTTLLIDHGAQPQQQQSNGHTQQQHDPQGSGLGARDKWDRIKWKVVANFVQSHTPNLSQWEASFVDSILDQDKVLLSDKQWRCLWDIADKLIEKYG
jgi:hypothetical protein